MMREQIGLRRVFSLVNPVTTWCFKARRGMIEYWQSQTSEDENHEPNEQTGGIFQEY